MPGRAVSKRIDATKAQAKANRKKHNAQLKTDKKKQDTVQDANVAASES